LPAAAGGWYTGRVEIRHLAALAAVGRERSFNGAARRLGYVQSAVSQQVAELERIVGERLVERSPGAGTVSLTGAGRLLVGHAESILARVTAARADLAALDRHPRLRVGLDGAVGARLLPAALALLDPEAAVRIALEEDGDDAALLDRVAAGELDVAFAELPLPEGPFAWLELVEDPCVLLVPSRSPLAEQPQPPSVTDLAAMPLVALDRSRFQARVDAVLGCHGHVRHVQRVSSCAAARALVAAGAGAAILPRLGVDAADPDTVAIELPDLPPRTLVLAWHGERRLSPDGARFRAAAAGACERLPP
jgi:molybdate transport repressor ModE-like protein